jgi:urea carboxylase
VTLTEDGPVIGSTSRSTFIVVEPGALTTVQDLPGRIGYWDVGVPPSGPMDSLSHRLVNRIVGNDGSAAALECTGIGPRLRFERAALVCIGGASMRFEVDGVAQPLWQPVRVAAGAEVSLGVIAGAGQRTYLAIRGGIDAVPYLGSRSTFTLGAFGGHEGRALLAGDRVHLGAPDDSPFAPGSPPPGLVPVLGSHWEIGVLVGPHTAPEFFTPDGLDAFFRAEWEVHFNSARTGVRLIGPRPRWARADGGEAGLHPSNIHDTGYAFGAVDITGDMPVILGPDGPSLGGFVCPAVVATAELWKLGQLRPGDRLRLVPTSQAAADRAVRATDRWVDRATDVVEPVARPAWNGPMHITGGVGDAILARREAHGDLPAVTYRQAGDRFLLVEFGEMLLDLELRVRVHALSSWVRANLGDGVVDATPGVRSLLVQVDGESLTITGALARLREAEDEFVALGDTSFPSRIVHLPLSWDDPATREAIERYMNGVRPDAPWCPWNIEFIRRINGLASVDDVQRIVFDASYLVLGLGDVYLGAPVATPLDPRHRLVTTKYNPARTWTPENAVGIGGAYLCIYGMEGPGGYQFVGRTVQVWNRARLGPHFTEPWLLRPFDQLRFHAVGAEELLDLRADQARGTLALRIEHGSFDLGEHRAFLSKDHDEIEQFRLVQREAFACERQAWAAAGEFDER